jgi:hypothetical protein
MTALAHLATETVTAPLPWAQTVSGRAFPLLNPTPADVDFRDIAEHLAKIPRYCGASPTPYSVAQHSVVVAELLPVEVRPYGILHDGKEFVIGDLLTPVKEALILLGAGDALARLEAPIDAAIHGAAGLPWPPPPHIARMVKAADMVALATEKRDLLIDVPWDIALPAPAPFVIVPWAWHRALDVFADRCRRWLVLPDLLAMRLGG